MRSHESDALHESIGRISQARRRVPANGQVHPRSGEQGDMEPNGGAVAALRGRVPAATPAAAIDAVPPARRCPALARRQKALHDRWKTAGKLSMRRVHGEPALTPPPPACLRPDGSADPVPLTRPEAAEPCERRLLSAVFRSSGVYGLGTKPNGSANIARMPSVTPWPVV